MDQRSDIVPTDVKRLRACMLCALVKTQEQFRKNGCDNCDNVLHLKDNLERIMDCTSATFDGMMAMMKPDESWVARSHYLTKFNKGVYALRIEGLLPSYVRDSLAKKGITYYPRDGRLDEEGSVASRLVA